MGVVWVVDFSILMSLYTGWVRFLYSVHNPKDSLNVTWCLESLERINTGIEGACNG